MDEEVGCDAAGIIPIAPPAQETVGIVGAFGCGAEERVPVEILAGPHIRVGRIGPEIVKVVARVIDLRDHYIAEDSLFDICVRLLVRIVGHALHADLHLDARLFYSRHNLL